jgi:hypothetical protein
VIILWWCDMFNMAHPLIECTRKGHWSVIWLLLSEGVKSSEIYKRMLIQCGITLWGREKLMNRWKDSKEGLSVVIYILCAIDCNMLRLRTRSVSQFWDKYWISIDEILKWESVMEISDSRMAWGPSKNILQSNQETCRSLYKVTMLFFWVLTPWPVFWRWRQKHWYLHTSPHSVRTQKNDIVNFTTMRTSNLTLYKVQWKARWLCRKRRMSNYYGLFCQNL